MKRLILPLLFLLLLITSAAAAPVMTGNGYTAYLGENNYLYLAAPDKSVKVLRAPIWDILSMQGGKLYCRTDSGKIYSIALDGTAQTAIYATAPTAEETEAVTVKPPFTLENGVLTRPADPSALILDTPISTAATAAGFDEEYIWFVENADGVGTLKRVPLEDRNAAPETVAQVIAAPLSLTVSPDAIALVAENHSVLVIARENAAQTYLPQQTETMDANTAAVIGQQVFHYLKDESGAYLFRHVSALPTNQNVIYEKSGDLTQVTPTPTPQKTSTLVTAKPTNTPKPTAKKTATPKPTDGSLTKGNSGSAVKKMQNRLIALGYPLDKADGKFGDNTLLAVNLFQHAIGYKERNYITESALKKLHASGAPIYDPCMPLEKGDSGAAVKVMQKRLDELGYDPGKIDGKYGDMTVKALKAFQQAQGLKANGVATRETLMALFEDEIPNSDPIEPTKPKNTPIATPNEYKPGGSSTPGTGGSSATASDLKPGSSSGTPTEPEPDKPSEPETGSEPDAGSQPETPPASGTDL